MYLWWRLFYGVMDSRWFVALARAVVRVADRMKPGAALTTLELRLGETWPLRVPGWVNVYVSRFLWRVRRVSVATPPAVRSAQRRRSVRIRIGCIGPFSGLLGFPPSLFAAFPREADLYIYDLRYRGQLAPVLRTMAARYHALDLESGPDYDASVQKAADAINGDELDLLLMIRHKSDAYDILDRLRTPCIANVCTGSDVLHHPNVDFDLFCQPEVGFLPVGRDLMCGYTRRPVPGCRVYPASLCFDRRGLDLQAARPAWAERLPLIVFHGSLYKLASRPFLDCLFAVMSDASDVEFAFMGKDWDGALQRIDSAARRWGVQGRVHYEGAFSAMRNADGEIHDAGWGRLLALLAQARLAPDPWPMGGASARFEAYAMGAPTVHMGLRTDEASWGQPQPVACEVPNLLVPQATAYSVDEYRRLCVACLTDGVFADDVVRTQRVVAAAASDAGSYWAQVFRIFEDWESMRTVNA